MQLGSSPPIRSGFLPPGLMPVPPSQARGARAEATGFSYDAQQSAELTIVTAEGDKVTISASHSLSIDAATYDARGRLRGGVEGAFYERTETSSISMQVEGTLSKDELKDIAKVVKELAKIDRVLDKGRQAPAVRRLAGADFDTLASVQAAFTSSQQIEAARLSVVATPPAPLGGRAAPVPPIVEPGPQPSLMPDFSNTTVASAE